MVFQRFVQVIDDRKVLSACSTARSPVALRRIQFRKKVIHPPRAGSGGSNACPIRGIMSPQMSPSPQKVRDLGTTAPAAVQSPPEQSLQGLSKWVRRLVEGLDIPGEIETPSGDRIRLGAREPKFKVRFLNESFLKLPQDEFSLGEAYVNGDLDIEGDMLAMLDARDVLANRFRLRPWASFVTNLFLRTPVRVNKTAITDHYTLGNDFYTQFIDRAYRFYSHCIFESDDETL